jgi:4-carboxymuconolactone decarboxylase
MANPGNPFTSTGGWERTMAKKRKAATGSMTSRLAPLDEAQMTPAQIALRDSITKSRGKVVFGGPFAVFVRAPEYGDLAQKLGAHCRYGSGIEPRLSEFAILVVARWWKSQFEWYSHAPIAEKAGVKPQTIKDLRAGRVPKAAAKDERALYDFITELYKTRRVSQKNYDRVRAVLGDTGVIELTGILGYYALVSITLNVFRMPLPEGEPLPFAER